MAEMTEEEADELDELLTRTTPKIRTGEGGFFTKQRNLLNALDPVASNYIRSQAEIKHQSPAEIIGEMVQERIAASFQDDLHGVTV
jgi:hypothetical protein